jgi:nucleoside-diphosphate-sugar epimerase
VNDFTLNAYLKKHLDVFLPYTYRPYIHVYDLARVVWKILNKFDHVKNNVFNIGFIGENHQKIKIAEAIKKFIPDLKIDVTEKGTDLRDYQVDFSKLKKCLGLRNIYTIDNAIKQIISLLESGVISDPQDRAYYNTSPLM